MSEHNWFILAIIIYMLGMLAIGYWSYRQTDEYDEYMLAGRNLGPFTAALSAGASDMSGWLLMGLPGALYVTGMSELWIAIGLLVGCWASWKLVAPRLRSYTEIADNSITIPSFFENRLDDKTHILRVASAVIILVFFTFYISSGMVAGGRYFESSFGGDYLTGMMIVAFVTVAYTFVGGFMAVAYTDVVQGTIMFLALLIVPVAAYFSLSDPSIVTTWATSKPYGPWGEGGNPNYFNMLSGVSAAAIIGNLAWGLGYFGQPHIVVRYMALKNTHETKNGRRIGILWMFLCILGATGVAVVGTAFFGSDPSIHVTDQQAYETIFLDMGRILFHPLIAGLILTAVLAAIMSTLSSQLLVVSSALIEDLFKLFKKELPSNQVMINLSRTAVVVVSIIAAAMAINPSDSILGLVAFAWSGFGSAFGPLMIACLYWRRLNMPGAVAGMFTGAIVSFAWGMSPLSDQMYEMVPGFISASVVLVVVSLMTKPPADSVVEEFNIATELHEVAADNPDMDMEEAAEIVLEDESSNSDQAADTDIALKERPSK